MNTHGAVMYYIENLKNFIRTRKNAGLEVNEKKKTRSTEKF